MFTRIELQGSSNTRDLGGLPADAGRHIRPHRLIRSCSLAPLTDEDKHILTDTYNLKAVVDFRTDKECAEKPDPDMEGVVYHHLPVIEDVAAGITHDSESEGNSVQNTVGLLIKNQISPEDYMKKMYMDIAVSSYSRAAYRSFFDILLNQEDGAILWHCSAGKDRAGIGSALILYALGVPKDIIVKDYLMTGEFLKQTIAHAQDIILKKTGDTSLANCVRVCMEVEKSYIESVFRVFRDEYGSVDEFLKKNLGLTDGKSEKLKNMYLK